MTSSNSHYLHSRVLKINVGFLLSAGPGNSHSSRLDIPSAVQIADDVIVNYLEGDIRLTRTKEGILVQANLTAGYNNDCSRCLDAVVQDITMDVEELYMHPAPVASEFAVGADAILDLAPLLRAEILLTAGQSVLCREDCKGLCATCGINLNHDSCSCADDYIDPRMAKLKELLDQAD